MFSTFICHKPEQWQKLMQQETNAGDFYMRKMFTRAICSAAVNVIVCPSLAAVLDQLSQNFDHASVLVCIVYI